MSEVVIKTISDGRQLTVNAGIIYLDGVKEAEDIDAVIYHPNRERIMEVMPEATHMAGRVPLTWEEALATQSALNEHKDAFEKSPAGIADRIRRAQNKGMLARD